jgi:hypothetical protein
MAANENIGQARMVQCFEDYCVRLSSEHLQKSAFGDIYAFSKANVFVSNKDKSKNRLFSNFEGSFDPTIGRFYLNKEGEDFEYVIDTKFKKVISFRVK